MVPLIIFRKFCQKFWLSSKMIFIGPVISRLALVSANQLQTLFVLFSVFLRDSNELELRLKKIIAIATYQKLEKADARDNHIIQRFLSM